MGQKELFDEATSYQFNTESIELGPFTSYSLLNDPIHMCFVLSRYKFCAKMFSGKRNILEIGVGDAFGIPIIAQNADYVLGIDVDSRLIDGNRKRLNRLPNVEFEKINICDKNQNKLNKYGLFDGIFSIDVIEHLDRDLEKKFMENSIRILSDDGVYIIGTPNISANIYATERSKVQHINLKGHRELKELMNKYFKNVFIFSMNDEVIHTGYYSMAHYLFGMGIGVI